MMSGVKRGNGHKKKGCKKKIKRDFQEQSTVCPNMQTDVQKPADLQYVQEEEKKKKLL